jgi:hypothetical protein
MKTGSIIYNKNHIELREGFMVHGSWFMVQLDQMTFDCH